MLLSILLGASLGGPVSAAPGGPNCKVENRTSGSKPKDLALAIQGAAPGDVLQIQGVCAGGFVVDKELTLRGKGSKDTPVATLSGATPTGSTRTLTITGSGQVTVQNLNITNGNALESDNFGSGGNILIDGELILVDSTISGGTATCGGNIATTPTGRLYVGSSRVTNGRALVAGGGICIAGIETTLSGVVIEGNRTDLGSGGLGGGLFVSGAAVVSSADIRNNHADSGGGLYLRGFLRYESLTITGNVAHATVGPRGGGFCLDPEAFLDGLGPLLGVVGNTPDDVCPTWHLGWTPYVHDFLLTDGVYTFRLTNWGTQPVTFSSSSITAASSPAGGLLTFDGTQADDCLTAHGASGTPLDPLRSCEIDASFVQNPSPACSTRRDVSAFIEVAYFTDVAMTTTATASATALAQFIEC